MANDSCPFDHQLLSRYVSCDCESEERMRVERHVRSCRQCRRELYELESVWSMLEEWQVNEAEAPFQPEALRAGLETRFGKSRGFASWREILSSLWERGVLKPVPVAVVVGLSAAVLAWWDTFTGPQLLDPSRTIARMEPTPISEPLEGRSPGGAKEFDLEKALRELDRTAPSFGRIQNVAGVRVSGRAEDVRSDFNLPSVPPPFSPPQAGIIFASANRL